jgi:copper resistance protein D
VIVNRALLEWPLVAAMTINFGTASFALISADESVYDFSRAVDSLIPAWRMLAIVALVMSPLVALDITAEMAGVTWRAAIPLVPEVVAGTHAGRVWTWFFPALAALTIATCVPIRAALRAIAVAGLSGLLLFLQAMLSHATDHGIFAVFVYFLHAAAAGAWIGALLGLWIITRRGDPPEAWLERAALRVSMIAAWSVAIIVISGIYTAYHGLQFNLYHLLYSSYGRTLLVKIAIFAAVLPIAAYNRYWLIPEIVTPSAQRRLVRNVGFESLILVIGVLGFAALLANTPPTHPHAMRPGMTMSM